MKIKKFCGLVLLMSSLMISACGPKPAPSSNPSSEPDQSQPSSQGGGGQSSQGGGEQSSQGGGEQSSQGGEQSSQGGDDTSEQVATKAFTVTAFGFEKKADNKVYLKIAGTQENHSAAEFKWAWGLAANGQEGAVEFVYGKATPEAADFAALTFDASNAFTAELCLSDIAALSSGTFTVYGGTPDTYRAINPIDENSSAKDGSFKYYIRTDLNQICLDELPVVALEEAVVYNPGADLPTGKQAGVYVKIGGAVKAGVNVDELTVKADFQRVAPGYSKHPNGGNFPENEMFWTKDTANGKAYINLYVGFMAVGEKWMTHLGFNTNNNPNCFMANDINDVEYKFGDDEINKVYTVNAKESEGQQGTYYGCLGFSVARDHEIVDTKVNFKEWVKADLTAAVPNASSLTSTTYADDVIGYKWNSADNAKATFAYTATETGTATFRLLLSPKSGNQSSTGFWRQGSSAKTEVIVNGQPVTAPTNDLDFTGCTTASATAKDGSSTMMEPQWFNIVDVNLTAGQAITINVNYLTGGYSFYLCGAALAK